MVVVVLFSPVEIILGFLVDACDFARSKAQNNEASQRKEAPVAAALTGKRKLQSLGSKIVAFGTRSEE